MIAQTPAINNKLIMIVPKFSIISIYKLSFQNGSVPTFASITVTVSLPHYTF